MNKQEYIKAVKEFAKEYRKKTYVIDQDKMLRAFIRDELKRVRECFKDLENVGSLENLHDLAIRFESAYYYRKNSATSRLF